MALAGTVVLAGTLVLVETMLLAGTTVLVEQMVVLAEQTMTVQVEPTIMDKVEPPNYGFAAGNEAIEPARSWGCLWLRELRHYLIVIIYHPLLDGSDFSLPAHVTWTWGVHSLTNCSCNDL